MNDVLIAILKRESLIAHLFRYLISKQIKLA